jgi:IS30 family transposase
MGRSKEKPKGRPCGAKLEKPLTEKIMKLRKRYKCGPNKIVGYLHHKSIDVNHHQVYDAICQAGLNRPIIAPRKTWGTKRFEREHNNSLWQVDFKLCDDDYWLISYQDRTTIRKAIKNSKYCYG